MLVWTNVARYTYGSSLMQSLKEVEQARVIMKEAENWSVLRWLSEKKKVRRAADAANAALHAEHDDLKACWPDDLRRAYDAISGKGRPDGIGDDVLRLANQLHQADAKANAAHEQAEATFAEAEKKLSTAIARQGCAEALRSWDLLEKANAKAAAAGKSTTSI